MSVIHPDLENEWPTSEEGWAVWREFNQMCKQHLSPGERKLEDQKIEARNFAYDIAKRFRTINNMWRYDTSWTYSTLRGHDTVINIESTFAFKDVSYDDIKALAALEEGKKLDRWITINNYTGGFADLDREGRCRKCDKIIEWETNGREVRAKGETCKYYGGYPPYVFYLPVPSGKIVVGNDFRELFPVNDEGERSCWTSHSGMRDLVQKYAAEGMAHAFVGNTCPSIHRITPELYTIGMGYYDEGSDPHWEREIAIGEEMAFVCTDLWWYSICDYDEYVKRANAEPHDKVVEVPAGIYKFTHQYHCIDRDKPGLVPYAWFELHARADFMIPHPEDGND